ncbi:MAG: type II toxin-antitoxin system HicB family antitoxin [Candidatus Poribacteria bacterium]|nr:type II toxin-antitoxin system HicB family antitoxin [Candidatus Poribacteria bacterium]
MTLHCLIEKDDDLYSALCLELNVASQGGTADEARRNLQEAVALYLEVVYEEGDEEEFIPRPAPMEEWLKFFEVEATRLKIADANSSMNHHHAS